MTRGSLFNADWQSIIDRPGGAAQIDREARETEAFRRAREVGCAVDLLHLTLAYRLGSRGLRQTAGWAEAIGLASLSSVALLKRLRKAVPWLLLTPDGRVKNGMWRLLRMVLASLLEAIARHRT